MEGKTYTISLLGDIMLGRLIDQLLPVHVHEPQEARHVASMRSRHTELRDYDLKSPWGDTIPLLDRSDLVIGNLETSATTCEDKWPDKVFNYRMHPSNIECLKIAGIDHVSLANNHTLDFGRKGLLDTIEVVRSSGITHAGAGLTTSEAHIPAVLRLPNLTDPASKDSQGHELHLYSFSDHPLNWQKVPEFNLIAYNTADQSRIQQILTQRHLDSTATPSLKIVSMHWGPNYSWEPSSTDITTLAHFLIDECGVDVIHGHSSHHVQGIEIYKSKLILYGCGDFLDDYAVVPNFRNDLSAVWNVMVTEPEPGKLKLGRVEVFPTRIKLFKTGLLSAGDSDHSFVCSKVRDLSRKFGTAARSELGDDGQLVIDITRTVE